MNLGKTWSQFIIGTLKVRQHRRKISKSIDTKNEKIETKKFGFDPRVSAPNEFFCSVPRLRMDCYNTMIN